LEGIVDLKIKSWVLTPHAVERVLARKISMEELGSLIQEPDQIIPQGPKFILVRRFPRRKDNNVAAILIEKKGEGLWVVITVMVNFQKK
jgi:hypothetical protein